MSVFIDSNVAQKIRNLVAIATISSSRFNAFCEKIQPITLPPGDFLFKLGDCRSDLIYLIEGEVSLQALGMQVEVVNAESCSGRFALAHQIPRKIDALALTAVTYIQLDSQELIAFVHENEEDNELMDTEKSEGNSDDWMTAILKSPLYKRLPPANLQKLLMGLQEVVVPKDAVIIKQGEEGVFYYLIKRGQCVLSRKPNEHAREVILAQLRAGDMFGEDALLSDQPISTSVTTLTQAVLLRIDKEQFITLIKEPALKYVEANALQKEIDEGALILDVRLQDVYDAKHLKNSISVPFFSLRMQLQLRILERTRPVVVVCDDGKISQAAVFLLLRNKISAKVLKGGFAQLESEFSAVDFEFESEGSRAVTLTQQTAALVGEATVFLEGVNAKARIESITDENLKLKKELDDFKVQYERVMQEKQMLEKTCRILTKQTEKLKEVLQRLQSA